MFKLCLHYSFKFLGVILVISSRRILNGIRRRNDEVPSLSRAEGFVSPVSDEPADNLGSGRCIAIEFNLNQ